MARQDIPGRKAVPQLRYKVGFVEPPDVESGGFNYGRLPGAQRCSVDGLERGRCQMQRLMDGEALKYFHVEASPYCRYHTKLALGLTEPSFEAYPVWPLPIQGYQLVLSAEPKAA